MEPLQTGLAVLTRPSIQEQDALRKNFGGRPQVPLHEAFGSPDEAADAYCSNALQRKILRILATPLSSGAKSKGLMLAEIAHKIVIEEEVVLKCLIAEYSRGGLFTAVQGRSPGKRTFALAPLADWTSYPPGMQPCTLWALAKASLMKAGAAGLSLEDLREQCLARGFQGFESLPDEMCNVMLRGVLSGEVAGGGVLQLPTGNVALAACIKAQQAAPEPAVPFQDVKEKAPHLANGASTIAASAVGMQTPSRHSEESPEKDSQAHKGSVAVKEPPSPLTHLRQAPPKAAPPTTTGVNSVEYFGQGMLRKTTTSASSEVSPRQQAEGTQEFGVRDRSQSEEQQSSDAAADSPVAPHDVGKPKRFRPTMFKGPSIPTAREADITPAILKHVERQPAPAPEAPTPISPAMLKHRPRSPPRTTSESAETPVVLSPALLKKRDKQLDPATPPNKEPLTRSPVSPSDAPAAQDSDVPDKMKAAVAALANAQPGIPADKVQSLVRDMAGAPALARRLRTKMMLEGFARDQIELKGGLEAAVQDAMAALTLAE